MSALTVPSLVCTVEGLLRLGFHATTVLYEEQLHDPQLWLNLQTRYDPEVAEDRAAETVAAITPLRVG